MKTIGMWAVFLFRVLFTLMTVAVLVIVIPLTWLVSLMVFPFMYRRWTVFSQRDWWDIPWDLEVIVLDNLVKENWVDIGRWGFPPEKKLTLSPLYQDVKIHAERCTRFLEMQERMTKC